MSKHGDSRDEGKVRVIDISHTARFVPDNSTSPPGLSAFGDIAATNLVDEHAVIEQATQVDFESDPEEEIEEEDGTSSENLTPEPPIDAEQVTLSQALGWEHSPENGAHDVSDSTQNAAWSNNIDSLEGTPSGNAASLLGQNFGTQETDTGHGRKNPHSIWQDQNVILPFNLLQTCQFDLSLLQDIHFSTGLVDQDAELPHTRVICQEALHQQLPATSYKLGQHERLNMIAQIPELGVIAVGNQVGRVGILTITKRWLCKDEQYDGIEIECILPFKSQEVKGMRPRATLMGMAVSPIQGQERRPEPGSAHDISAESGTNQRGPVGPCRRFRIILVYSNHTVLSYEISRPSEDETMMI